MMQTTRRFSHISFFRGLAIGAALLALIAAPAAARPTQPSRADRQITFAVYTLMERDHLTGQHLDNMISERTLKSLIKDLDPLKLFFYQSDIDDFNRSKDSLDDQIKEGDIHFAYDVFARFLARVDERMAMAEEQLKKHHDFSVDESMIRDPEKATFAKTPEEAAERWRQRVK